MELLGLIFPTVFPVRRMLALPSAINTWAFPVTENEAVHLPVHFMFPFAVEVHFPVRRDFSAGMSEVASEISPVMPFPRQSKTWAVALSVFPVLRVNFGEPFSFDLDKTKPSGV